MSGFVLRAWRVVTPDGIRPAAIRVENGVIAAVAPYESALEDFVDAGSLVVMPGVVDTHVHVNEPGRTEWEGFETATRAAAAGGVTTIVDMPLNSIPATTSVAALDAKRAAAEGRCAVDVGFWGGVVPDNVDALPALADAGVLGFKCFLVPSGVPEFEHVGEPELRRALETIAPLGLPLLVHAEAPELIREADGDARAHGAYLATRPAEAEIAAVEMLIGLVRATRARVHVVHVSSARVLSALHYARAQRLPITAETCPHYLRFAAEQIPDGATEYKCAPPIRSLRNRERLWAALATGELDMIASDHSPCPPELKRTDGDFLRAWGGIASLQLMLPVVWTGASRRGLGLGDVARWLCSAPAALAGLAAKGAIQAGRDADLVLFDPDARWTVDAKRLEHRHAVTPYDGVELRGGVVATYLRGRAIFHDGSFTGQPEGRVLTASADAWTSPN